MLEKEVIARTEDDLLREYKDYVQELANKDLAGLAFEDGIFLSVVSPEAYELSILSIDYTKGPIYKDIIDALSGGREFHLVSTAVNCAGYEEWITKGWYRAYERNNLTNDQLAEVADVCKKHLVDNVDLRVLHKLNTIR